MGSSDEKGRPLILFAILCLIVGMSFVNTSGLIEMNSLFTSNGSVISPKDNLSINSSSYWLNGSEINDWGDFIEDVTIAKTLDVKGDYYQNGVQGFTGDCINVSYSGGLATSCND